MTYSQWMKQIDVAFEGGDFFCMENLVEEYCAKFDDNETAMDALDAYLADPFVRNQLPGGFAF